MKIKLLFLISFACLSNFSIAQTPINGSITTTNGTGINIVSRYLKYMYDKDQSKFVKIKTGIPYANGIGMTSLYIDYWGYEQAWRVMVGWYVYNDDFYSPSFNMLGNYTHDQVILSNENGYVAISIPIKTFSNFGNITINSMTAGTNLPANWMDNWAIEVGVTPAATNQKILQADNRISSNGNVLIGKFSQTNTAYKLDVAGKIRSDEIVVNTDGADFVFEGDYELPELEFVERLYQGKQTSSGNSVCRHHEGGRNGCGRIQYKTPSKN